MTGRGQSSFVHFPSLAARLYNSLTQTRAIQVQCGEIASDLASRIDGGRILDVGTGPGRLLFELNRRNPAFELFGLDISASMVELARRQLSGFGVDIRLGNIEHAQFSDNFFDLVTCTGSFYLWDNPLECLEEIFRILKPGRSAYLFETYRDCDREAVRRAFQSNLRRENLFRRIIAPRLLLKQLNMTYQTSEMDAIIKQTSFAQSYSIDRVRLAEVPVWLRITLTKNV